MLLSLTPASWITDGPEEAVSVWWRVGYFALACGYCIIGRYVLRRSRRAWFALLGYIGCVGLVGIVTSDELTNEPPIWTWFMLVLSLLMLMTFLTGMYLGGRKAFDQSAVVRTVITADQKDSVSHNGTTDTT
jgi:hypothetical protein